MDRGERGGVQAIPLTLQQSLTGRLDRLGSAREVAQIGAVIGRDFSYKLRRVVAGMDDAPLQAVQEKLADADTRPETRRAGPEGTKGYRLFWSFRFLVRLSARGIRQL